jgi:hypothetical protein
MALVQRVRMITDRDGKVGQWREPRNGGEPFATGRGVIETYEVDRRINQRVKRSTFVDLLAFGDLAEYVASAEAGQVLQVVGEIEARDWVSKDGTRSGVNLSMVVQRVVLADDAVTSLMVAD